MKNVRLGIIGMGNMGSTHARKILEGKVKNVTLAAITDSDTKRYLDFPDIPTFSTSEELIKSGKVDAVLIATPHYDHTPLGIAALEAGLHVLVEKPISVHKADCERLLQAYEKTSPKPIFSAMFNQRTDPAYRKVRDLIKRGEIGDILRVNWIITDWFRTEAYYASGGWRATWGGEGGGVLLNQCPHQLDLLQWLCGMPEEVTGFCAFGKYHEIEVEDDVTAFLRYPNGATGVFVTSTGEAPGTNRLEITGDRGRIVIEDRKITFLRTIEPVREFSKSCPGGFTKPEIWTIDIPVENFGGQHVAIMQNFADAILEGKELIAPAVEGIHSVELANAILMSAFQNRPVTLPLSSDEYEAELKKKIKNSTFVKKAPTKPVEPTDFDKSF
ncbi:MAG: Gfo/Idh/MocA family oxidoreductase [Opitutales bacterium]|nr:Gfo/Idh/MocA family oxidoreductase [Opitutales bacterium]